MHKPLNMKQFFCFLLISLLFSVAHVNAQFITVTTEGTKQGKFRGESVRGKFNDRSELAGYLMEIISPRDPASGLATGKRINQPVVLLKASGGSSPQYMQALVQNELLKKVVIDFFRTDVNGTELNYYSVTLENVSVAGYKQFTGPLESEKFNPANNALLYDEIRLVYQRITVEDKVNKTIAVDERF